MATKSSRSSGTQINNKGVAQGVSLVDPKSGLPVSVILGSDGKYRIAADVQVTTNVGDLNVELNGVGPSGDTVAITDSVSGSKLKVNADGTIDVNVIVDAASGDNIYVVGTEDGTQVGIRRIIKIDSDGNLRVKDEQLNTTLSAINDKLAGSINVEADDLDIRNLTFATDKVDVSGSSVNVTGVATETTLSSVETSVQNIDAKLPTLGPNVAANSVSVTLATDEAPFAVNLDAFTLVDPDNVQLVGSINGTKTGAKYGFVNNLRLQILDSHDRIAAFSYADFGTKNQRITQIDYSSATFPGSTVRRQFSYSLVGTNYRRDNETWTIV